MLTKTGTDNENAIIFHNDFQEVPAASTEEATQSLTKMAAFDHKQRGAETQSHAPNQLTVGGLPEEIKQEELVNGLAQMTITSGE